MEGERLAASVSLDYEKGAVMGRHTHGDGGRRGQGPKPGPLMSLGTWLPPPPIIAAGGVLFRFWTRSPAGLRRESLGCLSS